MTLIERINEFVRAVGNEIKQLKAKVTQLENNQRSNAASINDTQSSSTATYSSQKVEQLIADSKQSILGGASSAYDTLKEVQTYIEQDKSGASAMATNIGNKLKVNEVHSLSSQELNNVRTSLQLGNTDTDLVAVFNQTLNSR